MLGVQNMNGMVVLKSTVLHAVRDHLLIVKKVFSANVKKSRPKIAGPILKHVSLYLEQLLLEIEHHGPSVKS